MHEQGTPHLEYLEISDRDARAMRRLHRLISIGLPELEPLTNALELEFIRSYRKAHTPGRGDQQDPHR